ncbi:S-adenosylmethionine:tRNA ribosyltransferase-isomerase [Caldalkalibacillus thermarum TA2.A1]|uniref:S-adenosylmethionine:tRNA ribosyltransferase-isomerase n=1 Tax=Caldalkalibacillus thermarum (strain TA2.A1) TaxID=986075 RepID=F5LAQ4_CALTT|nr:tRNA preQ1(34) S-adenosylmethionine ribosyltransferase-isomerase QueA [Caldalkalibacillus thermarum]EGL81626.1 S-adenosylmethionine:tRNA ribosyltransferase-isomerase [Caldalkalibacillus thermarum TA2.A1]GGK16132.1 S-adenosylmethionine:tRNA ribosyltransferase-isomerase [Caldalkalibacillus thermarum]
MRVDEFDFELPEELIAQKPLPDRASSRLLHLDRQTGAIFHHQFTDIVQLLTAGDVLVLNDTKVMPARLLGVKEETGAKVEVLLLKQIEGDSWETLVKPAKRVKPGVTLRFGDGRLRAVCTGVTDAGGRYIRFEYQGIFQEILAELGQMPLPPYIKEQLDDPDRYQTVYARHEGSAAAPTAGLHFTPAILQALEDKGVILTYITLHVGLGTFRPVQAERVEEHQMHAEFFQMPQETAQVLNQAKAEGRRIIAVGTTSVRTLETVVRAQNGRFGACSGWTDIFIYPGFRFQAIDGMLTNFHLPKSTLIMLVSAFAGKETIMQAYREAVKQRYRFFSFGDAMLIL